MLVYNQKNMNTNEYVKAWFTYEEIQGIIEAKADIKNWNIISEDEFNKFVENKLFSNFMINA